MRTNDRRTQMLARRLNLQHSDVAFGLEAVATLLAAGGFVDYLPRHHAEALAHMYALVEAGDAEALVQVLVRLPLET